MCEILGVVVKTWTADDKYSLRNSENCLLLIQMQLSKKRKTFSQFFAGFLKFPINFKNFLKKDDPHLLRILEITHYQRWG